jgi:hypothetical protein
MYIDAIDIQALSQRSTSVYENYRGIQINFLPLISSIDDLIDSSSFRRGRVPRTASGLSPLIENDADCFIEIEIFDSGVFACFERNVINFREGEKLICAHYNIRHDKSPALVETWFET